MFKLYPHQQKSKEKITAEIKKGHKKILLSASVSFGKTILVQDIAKGTIRKGRKLLFTTPRRALAEQTLEKFGDIKDEVSLFMAGSKSFDRKKAIQIGTLQSTTNRDLGDMDIIFIDEVHLFWNGKLVDNLLKRYPEAIVVGMTGTPINLNGYLLDGFDTYIDVCQLGKLIEMKFATPFDIYGGLINPKISQVKVTTGDYNIKELSQIMQPAVKEVVNKWVIFGEDRKTICYGVDIEHAEKLKAEFNSRVGIPVFIIHSQMSKEDLEKNYRSFETTKKCILVNVNMFSVGNDVPDASCIILARPTKSLALFIQMSGRIARLHKDKKSALILDCGGCIEEHGRPDDHREFVFKPKFSKLIDKQLGIDDKKQDHKATVVDPEREEYFKRITKVVDLYKDKVYQKESELQKDVNTFLAKTNLFNYRQNSGQAYIEGRWVHFASKSGLPDCSNYLHSTYFGIELKMPQGRLTNHQKQTLPEMLQRKVLVFIAQSVWDVFLIVEHMYENVIKTDDGVLVKSSVYDYPEQQMKYLEKLKLKKYLQTN